MNSDFLSQIISWKQKELRNKKNLFSSFSLKLKCRQKKPLREFQNALAVPGKLSLIAEVKKASPSRGILVKDFNPIKISQVYQNSGASALSILTEEKYFLGRLSFLAEVRQFVNLPILRKDFIIDEYQIYESYLAGADAVLLIARITPQLKLIRFLNLAKKLGLAAIVEVHDEVDLLKAIDSPAQVIGINNRNLRDFSVDLKVTKKLLPLIPADMIKISESGIKTKDDVRCLKDLGINAVLIGEAFLESNDIAARIKELFS